MSFYTMAFMGMAPFGSLLAGSLASAIGAPIAVIVTGTVVLLAPAWFSPACPPSGASFPHLSGDGYYLLLRGVQS